MCGIVGYVGKQKASSILLEGLKRLEYRGYDSAGVALLENEAITVFKKTGPVQNVADLLYQHDLPAQIGISHTRWATHGSVTEANAHPHLSWNGKLALVHNGVIENHEALRHFLEDENITFLSETDTEVFVNLIAYHYEREQEGTAANRLVNAVCHSATLIEGTYGIVALCTDCPEDLVGARKGSPLCLGVGRGEHMLASDVSAFVGRTQNVVYLDDGQIVHLRPDGFSITTIRRETVDPVINQIDWKIEQAELGHFTHYMEKEIFEQPSALENSMRGRFSDDQSTAKFGGLKLDAKQWRHVERILFCGCGTAWHACLTAKYLIEKYARIPVEVDYASEFRYRNAPLDKDTLVFVLSQSGETLDTLEALREAKRKGYPVLGITNQVGSSIARETDGGIYQHTGPEIGVASTKAFTSHILLSGMLALYLGRMRDLSFGDGRKMVTAFQSLPGLVNSVLDQADSIKAIAETYANHEHFLFLGRQNMVPIALEGALKLKEIAYLYATGYPAGEMKHGPIALITEKCASIVLAPHGDTLNKVIANIQEIRARKGPVIAITSAGKAFPTKAADAIIQIPQAHDCIMPILATIPLQLLSYFIAVIHDCNVDKPRNLAKSVTVE